MNEPKFADLSKTRLGVYGWIFLILYFLFSPIWVLVLILRLLRTSLKALVTRIFLPTIEFLTGKILSARSKLPKNAIFLVLTLPLIVIQLILSIIYFVVYLVYALLFFAIEMILFPLYMLHIILGRNRGFFPIEMEIESLRPLESLDFMKPLKSSNEWLKISVAFPKLLSKRFEGTFLFQIYSTKNRLAVTRAIKTEFKNEPIIEQTAPSNIQVGQNIEVKLFSPQINFSDPVTKSVKDDITKITFLGVPKDNCQSGFHKVLVSIIDTETKNEIDSMTIKVEVTDFAFDHVSKPLLSQISSVVLVIGSIAMFILTLFEQIDKTIGFTSGTAIGVVATVIYANFLNLYQHVRSNTP